MNLFDYADTYPLRAGYKGAETSRAAAESINVALLRAKVLRTFILRGDMTSDECAEAVMPHLTVEKAAQSIRPRVSELKRMGKLVDAGYRRRNRSGRSAAVLRVVP